jgi:hypothetical protein
MHASRPRTNNSIESSTVRKPKRGFMKNLSNVIRSRATAFVSLRVVLILCAAMVFAAFGVASAWNGGFDWLSIRQASAQGQAAGITPSAPSLIGTCDTAGPIEVESIGGTAAGVPTAYATLKLAFDAINPGVIHTGSIAIDVCGNTTETATASLNSGTVAPGSYTDVTIRPVGAARTITGSIVGAIIKLNGADNVTIDGRIGGVGAARSLTVSNTNTSTATAAIWLASVVAGNGASLNVIRNLEIAGGTDSGNSTNVSVGIIMCGTTIGTAVNGDDNDNNQFIFNRIIKARYGIVTRGTTTNLNIAPIVTDNTIGPSAFGTDQIGKTGILMQADTGATVIRNTVQTVGTLITQSNGFADHCGICIGTESWGVTDSATLTSSTYTVTKNVIHDVIEEKTGSAIGIKLGTTQSGGATNNLVANNFIYNIRANGTAGDQFVGIGISGGNGDRIVFNSISITGDVDPAGTTASSTWGGAIRIPGANAANNANFTLMDNSIYLDVNSNTATQHYFAITLNSAAYVFGTGGLNYNNYYINPANPQLRTGGLGSTTTTGPGPEFTDLAAWKLALTTVQDANSIQADPLYFSNTSDLHIPAASPNFDTGLAIAGVIDDIDSQVRPNPAPPSIPDIGADEFYTSPGTLQLSSATYSAAETAGTATITITRSGGVNGAVQVDYATVAGGTATGGLGCTPGVDYIDTSGTKMWADLDGVAQTFPITICPDGVFEPGETVNIALSNAMVASLGTPNTAVLTINDAGTSFSGSIDVGTGQIATSLTNPGGIFQGINNGAVSGNVTINITSNLTGETGAIALNEFATPFTVTIKPSGAARTVTGASSAGMIPFNGADMVTIDGSLAGGTDRSLTVTNTGSGGGITFSSTGALVGAHDNTVKNVNVIGGSSTATIIGIAFQGSSFGTAGTDNDNNRVENCDLRSSIYGIYSVGASAANKNTGVVITRNVMTGTGAARIGRIGIFVGNDDGIQVTENNIDGIVSAESADAVAIAAGTQSLGTTAPTPVDLTNALIARNRIGLVQQTNTFSAAGIALASGTSGTNTIVNNMISGVIANANAGDIVAGIYVLPIAGSTQNIYHNSVSMTGARGATAGQYGSFGLAIAGTDQLVNVRNNILFNTQTQTGGGAGGRSYAIGTAYSTFVNLSSSFNDLFVSGAQATLGITGGLLNIAGTGTGTDRTDLAAWNAATGQDAPPNSIPVDPLFISVTDLHITPSSPVVGAGTAIGSVTIDFDNDPRPAANPDIGADELVQAVGGVIPGGTYYNAAAAAAGTDVLGGNVTITNTLWLSGILSTTDPFTLTMGCNATISGPPVTYVIGSLKKNYCNAGVKVFEVGTANGYSPVSVNITAATFPTDFTVKAVQGPQPNIVTPGSALQRYWKLTATGVTADLIFNYIDADIPPPPTSENSFVIFKYDGSFSMPGGTVTPGSNSASITGVTSFSDWTLAQPNAPTAGSSRISGIVTRADGQPLGGVTVNLGGSGSARTITDGNGFYRFSNVETNGFYTVTPGLANYSFSPSSRSFSVVGDRTDAVFTGTSNSTATENPVNVGDFFVRQQYLDFLGREPDREGWLFWTDQLSSCGLDANCIREKRIDISAAFFQSAEFQEGGNYVYRLYRAALGRRLTYAEFSADRQQVIGGPGLDASRIAFADSFVERPEFVQKYQNISSGEVFVDALLRTVQQDAGLELSSQRESLIQSYNSGADLNHSRSAVLRAVAESGAFQDAVYNASFVLTEYFGYLQRGPDADGYAFWVEVLNHRDQGNYRGMVCSFLTSAEYQRRFSPVVIHSNNECGQ